MFVKYAQIRRTPDRKRKAGVFATESKRAPQQQKPETDGLKRVYILVVSLLPSALHNCLSADYHLTKAPFYKPLRYVFSFLFFLIHYGFRASMDSTAVVRSLTTYYV